MSGNVNSVGNGQDGLDMYGLQGQQNDDFQKAATPRSETNSTTTPNDVFLNAVQDGVQSNALFKSLTDFSSEVAKGNYFKTSSQKDSTTGTNTTTWSSNDSQRTYKLVKNADGSGVLSSMGGILQPGTQESLQNNSEIISDFDKNGKLISVDVGHSIQNGATVDPQSVKDQSVSNGVSASALFKSTSDFYTQVSGNGYIQGTTKLDASSGSITTTWSNSSNKNSFTMVKNLDGSSTLSATGQILQSGTLPNLQVNSTLVSTYDTNGNLNSVNLHHNL